VTDAGDAPRKLSWPSRRGLLLGAAATAGAGAVAGAGIHQALERGGSPVSGGTVSGGTVPGVTVPDVPAGAQPAGLPARQHAWDAYLAVDGQGNPVPPAYSRLLFFDVNGDPAPSYARLLEAALRTLERSYPWAPAGLLFTASWGPAYFGDVLRTAAPVPPATALSDFEQPALDDYHLCLHLASDNESRLAAVEAALTRGTPLPDARAAGPLDISSVLRLRQVRTGFVGNGLPAGHQDVNGIPGGRPVPKDSPLFMGFKSALRRNQASEDDVTIPDGPFTGGTTMHVSYMRLRLGTWYDQLSQPERVARMYAPQVTPEQVTEFTTDAESDPNLLAQAITRYGVIGHAQTSARARRNGNPIILRRDFDSTDGGLAGLHFVALQRTIADFVATRTAMNATSAQLQNPSISDTVNNGINEFIFVLKRGNYIVPARAQRSFPLLPAVA
jgi:dye decolorizing peroxidase